MRSLPALAIAVALTTPVGCCAAAQPAAAGVRHLSTFRSPSGNIGCMIFDDSDRCDIRTRSWSPPPAPPSCDTHIVDYGQGVEVDASGPGRLVCAGDTTLDPGAPALPYGTATVVSGFRCQSSVTDVSCTNTADGHGFTISARGYHLY